MPRSKKMYTGAKSRSIFSSFQQPSGRIPHQEKSTYNRDTQHCDPGKRLLPESQINVMHKALQLPKLKKVTVPRASATIDFEMIRPIPDNISKPILVENHVDNRIIRASTASTATTATTATTTTASATTTATTTGNMTTNRSAQVVSESAETNIIKPETTTAVTPTNTQGSLPPARLILEQPSTNPEKSSEQKQEDNNSTAGIVTESLLIPKQEIITDDEHYFEIIPVPESTSSTSSTSSGSGTGGVDINPSANTSDSINGATQQTEGSAASVPVAEDGGRCIIC